MKNESVPKKWHFLARSGLPEWPRKQATVYLVHSVLKTSYSVEANQLASKWGGGFTPDSEAALRINERGSFGSTFASVLVITNPTMSNRRNRSIDWPSLECQDKKVPANRTAGSHLPVVPEKLICPQTTHTQIKYQYDGQSLTKATLWTEPIQTCCIQHTNLKKQQ